VTGGINQTGPLSSSEIYNPVSRTFSAGPAMLTARYSHTATLLPHGDVLIAAGDNGAGELLTSERYHAGSFVSAGSLNHPRLGHVALLLPNGVVAAIGGSVATGGTVSSVELYHEGD